MQVNVLKEAGGGRGSDVRKVNLPLYTTPPSEELSLDDFEEYSLHRLEGLCARRLSALTFKTKNRCIALKC